MIYLFNFLKQFVFQCVFSWAFLALLAVGPNLIACQMRVYESQGRKIWEQSASTSVENIPDYSLQSKGCAPPPTNFVKGQLYRSSAISPHIQLEVHTQEPTYDCQISFASEQEWQEFLETF